MTRLKRGSPGVDEGRNRSGNAFGVGSNARRLRNPGRTSNGTWRSTVRLYAEVPSVSSAGAVNGRIGILFASLASAEFAHGGPRTSSAWRNGNRIKLSLDKLGRSLPILSLLPASPWAWQADWGPWSGNWRMAQQLMLRARGRD